MVQTGQQEYRAKTKTQTAEADLVQFNDLITQKDSGVNLWGGQVMGKGGKV